MAAQQVNNTDWGKIQDDALGQEYLEQQARYSQDVPVPAFIHAAVIASMAATNGIVWYWWAGWLALEVLQRYFRYVLYRRLVRAQTVPIATRLRLVTFSSALSGIVLSLSLLFLPEFSAIERMIQGVIFIGMCMAATNSTGGYRPVFLAYVIPILVPLTLAWGLTSDFVPLNVLWAMGEGFEGPYWQQLLLALAFAVYVMLMFAMARESFRVFKESFYMRFEHARLNEQLAHALEAAEASSSAKTRFLASASHDLRQPIHTLSLFCAALSTRDLDAKSREIADNLDIALESLGSQLDTLLDISKLDAGVVEVNPAPVDMSALLERLCREFRPLAEGKNLRLEVNCPKGCLVQTDSSLFERVVRNVLANAIKYTREGRIDLMVSARQGQYSLCIRDTGRGIPDHELRRVFEEFYQLDNPERDRTRGLGLGLAIVKRLGELLDMKLEIRSEVGKGTEFEILLPEPMDDIEEEEIVVPELVSEIVVDHRLVALVVDDEAAVRAGMEALLESMDYEVHTAESTEQAVALAKLYRPDIVLADFRLRGKDNGLRTIREIRFSMPDIPALIISGDTDPARIREAHDFGVTLLHKPVRGGDLRIAIAEAIQEAQAVA